MINKAHVYCIHITQVITGTVNKQSATTYDAGKVQGTIYFQNFAQPKIPAYIKKLV